MKIYTFFNTECYHCTHNRLQCGVNITFIWTRKQKKKSDPFYYNFLCIMAVQNWIYNTSKASLCQKVSAAAAAKSLQSCLTLCDPRETAQQAPPSLGFSRQEHWTGLPFPSPMHESEKWKWSSSILVTLSDPMDCSLPGSSVHGIFQARVLEWGAIAFSEKVSEGCEKVPPSLVWLYVNTSFQIKYMHMNS